MPSLKIHNPTYRMLMRAQVVRVQRLTPSFVNITFRSDVMSEFEYLGFDQAVRLFLPRVEQRELRLPSATGNGWIAKFLMTPGSHRPHVRNYTIRACRPEVNEMDIEFAIHGDHGAASAWALRARPGAQVGLFPEGIQYLPTAKAARHLLVADESALPAIMSILDHAPRDFRADVFLEVPTSDDVRSSPHRDRVRVNWLARDGRGGVPGQLALEAVRQTDLVADELYCFLAGESGLPTALRRHLVAERGLPKAAITFVGYWKHGKASIG